ncbi:hypothetical protein L227DRAFT_507479 [Lentinus tigrinus ALCF2SS1-6]|uniref:Uncharacterized protein n=1 Tax=Lentinus tigrinus ALCF2SS1-6 TaxID=1328759 RepID=A0A5C2S0Y5_9APHY|nr:hypothetical protein L227DRAFT_507479 [Lentinus tigrinus ALCF2SS1-6]
MNDREEIYPASVADSLSDYSPTVADDESEVDHAHLPPRMRILGPEPPLRGHARSQSTPYASTTSLPQQGLSRASSTRVIPVPPPTSRPSTPGSHLRKRSPDEPRANAPAPSPVYASASLAAQEMWQPPPPYSDSDTDSYSSSNPQTPAGTPTSSSSHLPRDFRKSAAPPLPEKRSQSHLRPEPVASSTSGQVASQPDNSGKVKKAEIVLRPPINARNASAPELHPPPPAVDVPPRPSTVPIPAEAAAPPQPRRRSSKNPSISTPPRDLDRIDELDESDPLGFAWHHGGPYEAIAKAAPALYPDAVPTQKRTQSSKRKSVQPNDISLGVSPGQIFPSYSQYQPQNAGHGVQRQLDPNVLPPKPPAEDFPVGSPPMSPLALPVRRHAPPAGQPPPTPDQYNNVHMNAMRATPAARAAALPEQGSRMHQQPQAQQVPPVPSPQYATRRSSPPAPAETSQPSPPLTNPYSPVETSFRDQRPSRRDSAPSGSRPISTAQPRGDLPPSNLVPMPDISLPPSRQDKPPSLLPRHLPKKLVMPAPLQQSAQQNQYLQPGQAHVEILAQRHGTSVPSPSRSPVGSPPSIATAQQQQHQHPQTRAQDIPMSHGPKLLRKRHTVGGTQPDVPAASSNATAAMFAARVRFAEPPKEETKEERKRREKEEAKRQKEQAKLEKEEAKREKERSKAMPRDIPLQGIFKPDYVKEAELARDREMAAQMSSSKSSAGRKLSKRR